MNFRIFSLILSQRRIMFALCLSLFSAGMVFGETTVQYAFAEPCEGILELRFDCQISGWTAFVLGDIVIGVALSAGFFIMSRYLNQRSRYILELVTANSDRNQRILSNQERSRQRLKSYAKQAFKNDCGALLLCFGMLDKLSKSGDDDWTKSPTVYKLLGKSRRIFDRVRNTINLSIGVIDPVLLEEIEKFLISVEDTVDDIDNISTKYGEIKSKIMYLADRLDKDVDDLL